MTVPTTAISRVCPRCRVTYPYKESHSCAAASASAQDPSAADGAAAPGGAPDDPLIGAILGDRYHIESYLQGGGMGIVYRARHIVLDKPLAVKVMRQAKDDLSQQRFLLEAKSACQINHEHIVDITDYGVLDDGRPYLVMELLQGRPLDSLIAKSPLAPRRACLIGEQIAYGLQVVHDKGILHRDLKPSKVTIEREAPSFVPNGPRSACSPTRRDAEQAVPAFQEEGLASFDHGLGPNATARPPLPKPARWLRCRHLQRLRWEPCSGRIDPATATAPETAPLPWRGGSRRESSVLVLLFCSC